MVFAERLERVRSFIEKFGVQGCIVSNPENIRYLSGFSSGSDGWLFVSAEFCAILTDGRYWAQVAKECPLAELIEYHSHQDGNWALCLAKWLNSKKWQGSLAFEGSVVFDTYLHMQEGLVQEGPAAKLVSLGHKLNELRMLKSAEEIELIRGAAAIADTAWKNVVKNVRVGMTEMEFCAELEYHMKRAGSTCASFDTIVASGPNGAYPHAGVTERAFQEGELITVDFGAVYKGYCSDMTRIMWLGTLDEASQKIYSVVREAHDKALEAVKPGLEGFEVDKIARDIIVEAGYGEAFSHSLGHGVGLAVHEAPGLRKESHIVLEAGMLTTIEPGIYLPGVGGCRVEDLVALIPGGRDVLSRSPYQELHHKHPGEAFA